MWGPGLPLAAEEVLTTQQIALGMAMAQGSLPLPQGALTLPVVMHWSKGHLAHLPPTP